MKRGVGITAIVLVGLLAGCSVEGSRGAPETITISAAGMAYGTNELTLQKGKIYRLVLANADSVEHDFAIAKIPVTIHQEGYGAEHDSAGHDSDLHVHAEPGMSEAVEFTPAEAGTYEFYCTVTGHKEAGMVGRLIVN